MSHPRVDESDLRTKLASTLRDFLREFGRPPVSTSILFEPYHECWGIYHSPRKMIPNDSPGDYEIQNAEVGMLPVPDSDYDRAEFETSLQRIGDNLIASLDARLRPANLGIELDYDRVYTFPRDSEDRENQNVSLA